MEAPKRRSQKERREGTIKKLLHAAAETLIEVGHAESSVQRICARAGVSHGALFRHFPTREALMVAVGEDVGTRLLARYRRRFAALPGGEEDVAEAIRLLRAACRSRLALAWYELLTAARTSETLRRGLTPVTRRYFADIVGLARELLPGLAASLGPTFDVLVATLLSTFDGETLERFVVEEPALEEARLKALIGVVEIIARQSQRPSAARPRAAPPARGRGRAAAGSGRSPAKSGA